MVLGEPGALLSRAAVLGSPVAHSLSPALHQAAYAALGLEDWTYDRFEVDEGGLAPFVEGLGESWREVSSPIQITGFLSNCSLCYTGLRNGHSLGRPIYHPHTPRIPPAPDATALASR